MLSALGLALASTTLSFGVVALPSPALARSAGPIGITSRVGVGAGFLDTVALDATTPLARGARGPRVADLQRALIAAGFTVRGGADGVFGAATQQALSSFQTAKGLRPTAVLDVTTAHVLGLGPAPALPRRGDRGEAVVTLQRALISAGVTVRGGADGVFGAATETAVSSFQSARGLAATGRVDVSTAIRLGIAPQESVAAASTTAPETAVNTATNTATNTAGLGTSAPNVQDASMVSTATNLPRRGQTGESVALVQRALIAAGVTVRGGADGIFGSATETALKIYQRGVRRPATGVLDEITAQLLGLLPAPTMPRRGDRGDSVVSLQKGLLARGVSLRGGADGVFGAATETAISTFQASLGLAATGRLDLVTYFAIVTGEATNASSSAASPGSASSSTGSSTSAPSTSTPSNSAPSSSAEPISAAIFPVQGPCWFTDTWHAPRSGGRRHMGVDIIAPTGKAVYAVADGMITRKFLDRPGSLGGNALRLTAADGTYFHYAHFSSFAEGIDVGSEVVAGQIIGYVGSTGSSSSPHLHFEYHPFGGAAVNPYPLVKKLDACKVVDVLPQPGSSTAATAPSSGETSN